LRELRRGGTDLFRAQRSTHHRENRRRGTGHWCRRRACRVRPTGRCARRELEQLMVDFYHPPPSACLVCTTIIESGIDVPHRQHHHDQSRRHTRAGAAAPAARAASDARTHRALRVSDRAAAPGAGRAMPFKRLEAIESMEELGAGICASATHDLEIRGAGELLGEEQKRPGDRDRAVPVSGHARARGAGSQGKAASRCSTSRLAARHRSSSCALPAFPAGGLRRANVHMRLSLYKRIAAADSEAALDELSAEIHDRFWPAAQCGAEPAAHRQTQTHGRAPWGCAGSTWACRAARCCSRSAPRIDPATVVRHDSERAHASTASEGPLKLRVSRQLPTESAPLRVCRGSAAAPRRTAPGPLECRAWTPASPPLQLTARPSPRGRCSPAVPAAAQEPPADRGHRRPGVQHRDHRISGHRHARWGRETGARRAGAGTHSIVAGDESTTGSAQVGHFRRHAASFPCGS